jgi:wobble nucleotide-excising tRNase
LKYIFIDDPVSSLDENHLIQLAVNLAQLVKSNRSNVKFVITTHNPLFYNVLHNELNSDDRKYEYKKQWFDKYRMTKLDDGTYQLVAQLNDSPFSYHLYLKSEIEKAIDRDQLSKYHFNFLRNILEKTSTFLGYRKWSDLLPQNDDGQAMMARIINISSHSSHAGEEVAVLTEEDKRILRDLVSEINTKYHFQQTKS